MRGKIGNRGLRIRERGSTGLVNVSQCTAPPCEPGPSRWNCLMDLGSFAATVMYDLGPSQLQPAPKPADLECCLARSLARAETISRRNASSRDRAFRVKGYLGQIRDAVGVWGQPKVPKEDFAFKVLIPVHDQEQVSAEPGSPERSLEVLIVVLGPSYIPHQSTKKVTPSYSRDAPVTVRPLLRPEFSLAEKPEASMFGNLGSLWPFECVQSQWYSCKRKYYKGKDIIEAAGKVPGLYKDIGREARNILLADYMDKSLGANANPDADTTSVLVGMSLLEPVRVSKFLFRSKAANTYFNINATQFTPSDAENVSGAVTKLVFDKVLGPGTKSILPIPYPYENEQLELRSDHRLAGMTALICPHGPSAEVTCLLGTYLLAAGGLLQFDAETQTLDYSVGGTARIKGFSFGLLMNKQDDVKTVELSLSKTLENKAPLPSVLTTRL